MKKRLIGFIGLVFTFGVAASAQPLLPKNQTSLHRFAVNNVDSSKSHQNTNLVVDRSTVIARSANPTLSAAGEQSTVHLEVSLSRRQVTVYDGETQVKTYPIAIGRAGHETPTGTFEIKQMRQNPAWIHPVTDRRLEGGIPENPLGTRWIGFWTDGRNWIGFHGTNSPASIGQAASHGCLRMHNKDVEELFEQVAIGTLVTVVE